MTRKWIEVNDLFGDQYSVTKNVRFKTLMLLCDYSDAYIIGKGRITMDDNNKKKKKIDFKNNAPLRSCISKVNDKLIKKGGRSQYCYANIVTQLLQSVRT